MDILSFLTEHHIPYQLFEHSAVMTCEEAAKLPPMPGTPTRPIRTRIVRAGEEYIFAG